MPYGEGLEKLNPLPDDVVVELLRRSAPKAEALLDLACGRGNRLMALPCAFPALRLYGIDADPGNAAAAEKNCPAAEIVIGDASALPYADRAFDAVLCECSFSLFTAPQTCAGEIARVLRTGGVLLLSDLYAKRSTLTAEQIAENGTVKTVYGREALERSFTAEGLAAEAFFDRSSDLTQMLGQMLMDGTLCSCLGKEALQQMKKLGTGYGLWLFRKQN